MKLWRLATAVALSACCVASASSLNRDAMRVCLLVAEIVLPLHLLRHAGRPMNARRLTYSSIALAYLCWGAFFSFQPGQPDPHADPWAGLVWTAWSARASLVGQPWVGAPYFDLHIRRWNWGLLAALYCFLLVYSSRRRASEPPRKGFGRFGRSAALWSGACLGGAAAWIVSSHRIDQTWWRWCVVLGTTAVFASISTLPSRPRAGRRSGFILAALLGLWWAFALSVKLTEDPLMIGATIIIRHRH